MRMEEFELDSILAEFSDHPEKQQEAATDEPAEPKPQGSQRETAHEAETPAVPERKEIPSEKPQSGTQVFHVPENDTQNDRETYADKNQTDKTGQKKTKAAGKDKNQPKKKKEGFFQRLGFGVLSLIFAALSLAALLWTLQNVSPDTSPMDYVEKGTATTDLVARLDTSINNSKANALSGIAYIPKHYSIPESDTVAPAPEEANFGSVSPDDAAAVMDIIQEARDSGLLEGQNVIFSPELNFRRDTEIKYYYDETILMILWKEIIDGNTVTCCEVKIADASQFRRKITDDTFGSSTKLFATSLSNSVNAVVAMNADFYMFRDFGIVVYNRELYRFGESVYTGNYKKYNCTWGEEAYVREQFQMMKICFVDKGYPVILGEYGANWREFSNSSVQKKHDASIRLFHKTVNEEAVKRGIIPYVWDINNPNRYGTGGIMCIIDRSKLAVFDTNSLEGIMDGVSVAQWGGPTGITNVKFNGNDNENGKGNQCYDLSGRRVPYGSKGLLIIGGKKVFF